MFGTQQGTTLSAAIAPTPVVGWARPAPRRADGKVAGAQTLGRLRKCMFLEYDAAAGNWRNVLESSERDKKSRAVRPQQQKARSREPAAVSVLDAPWWENPMVVGLLLAVCPPVGVTLAWTARSIPQAGRIALTVFGAFVMLTATCVVGLLLLQ